MSGATDAAPDASADAAATGVRIASLHVHPVKSCAGIAVPSARLDETGLEYDRWWMVIDADGEALTQRELPRLALVQPALRHADVVLRAPGMLALHLASDAAEGDVKVRLWDDALNACDMGDLAAQWFSDFLGQPVRLARFDPAQERASSRRWTGELTALNAFSDGFPLLVLSSASVAALNERLAVRGQPAVDVRRFRPNLVLDGLDAHGEDWVRDIVFDGEQGPVRLRLVKPCARCPMPNVDPDRGEAGTEPGDTLAGYRSDPRLNGALTFGMNAVVVEGFGEVLRVGQAGRAEITF